jgi:hypothetical protein
LEQLIRYTARGAVSLERLQEDANGDLVYIFTHPWTSSSTGTEMSGVDLIGKRPLHKLIDFAASELESYQKGSRKQQG